MPLRAVQGGENVLAYDQSDQEWAEIKRTYRERELRMPCCSSVAVPKTSVLGNHFFSHHVNHGCSSPPESPEHLYIKSQIAIAAIECGWTAISEFRGTSPTDAQWIADVLCINDGKRIAFEVQLSNQSETEFRNRQQTYLDSKVKALWFVSRKLRKQIQPTQSLPAFGLGDIAANRETMVRDFTAPIADVVKAVLSRRLVWAREDVELVYEEDVCTSCRRPLRKIVEWRSPENPEATESRIGKGVSFSRIRDRVGNQGLRDAGLCTLEPLDHGSTSGQQSFLYNKCVHCGTPQMNWAVSGSAPRVAQRGQVVCKAMGYETGRWKIQKNAT